MLYKVVEAGVHGAFLAACPCQISCTLVGPWILMVDSGAANIPVEGGHQRMFTVAIDVALPAPTN
jgi:hypothetical protein